MQPKAVSVIMPVYNASLHLEECLNSFMRQTFDDWELLCIDRGSTDGSRDILEAYAQKSSRVRVLYAGNERTSQFNIGVENSNSEFIYYTASDFRIDDTLLEDAVRAIRSEGSDGAWINCISEGSHFWARVRDFERTTYIGSQTFEGVRFFRRDTYLRVGGFRDDIPIFEEYDLQDRMLALGAKFSRVYTAAEHHLDEPTSLADIWRRSLYIGSQYPTYLRAHGTDALKYANPIRSTFLKDPRRYLRQPSLTAGLIALIATKYLAGGIGYVTSSFVHFKSHRDRYGSEK